jgi:uncharacterized protein
VGILTPDMQKVVLEQRLGFVATVRPDGTPNLSPKGTTTVRDEGRLMFADIASPGTVANVRANPAMEVNVVDPVLRKGYRFQGRGSVHEGDAEYETCLDLLADRGLESRASRIRAIVVVEVEHAEAIVSPAYEPGVSEQDIAAIWTQRLAARVAQIGIDPVLYYKRNLEKSDIIEDNDEDR